MQTLSANQSADAEEMNRWRDDDDDDGMVRGLVNIFRNVDTESIFQ